MTMRPTMLDLFSGACGGWSLGMERAGFRTVAACEIDPWRRAAFSHNFPDARMYDDVRSLSASRLVSDIGALPEIIVGSPPCQDASLANTRGKGVDGERTGLFFEAIRLVRECRPRWCAFENVLGLRTRGADRVLGALEAIGYTAWPFVVAAGDIGAPHLRKRVWIVASDAACVGCGAWGTRRPHSSDAGQFEQALSSSNPAQEQMGRAGFARREAWGHAADPELDAIRNEPRRCGREDGEGASDPLANQLFTHCDQAGRSSGQLESSLREKEVPDDRRSFLEAWSHWNGGPPSLGELDDGLSPEMARFRGLHRQCISAYGDAVAPQIPQAIGNSIWRVEAAMAIALGRDAA